MLNHVQVEAGEGRYCVIIDAYTTDGEGIWAFLHGGELSHVGGVVLATPRVTLAGDGATSDISQLCATDHKDVYLGAEIAKRLAIACQETISLTAGIHVDDAELNDIQELKANAHKAADKLIEKLC